MKSTVTEFDEPAADHAMHQLSDSSPACAVISCGVLEEEVRALLGRSGRAPALRFLPQGLHNTPALLRDRLQAAIDEIEQAPGIQTIAIVYGLCARGIEGIVARRARVVVPRAHDCITLLLGSRQRYADYVREHPGTYWYSTGWNRSHVPPGRERYESLLQSYRQRFSEEDAQYLMETEQAWFGTYDRATFVDLALVDSDADLTYTRRCAEWLNWSFDQQQGDPALLMDLLTGPWDPDRYLVLEPGETLRMTADDRIVDRVALTLKGGPIRGRSA